MSERRLRAWVYPQDAFAAPANCRRGEMSLDADWVARAEDADVLLVPYDAGILYDSGFEWASLPLWRARERDHLLIHTSDYTRALSVEAIVIRVSVLSNILGTDKRTIGWCGTAWDHGDLVGIPPGGFRFDATLRAFYNDLRRNVVNSCAWSKINLDWQLNQEFHGYIEATELGKRRRQEFLEGIRYSRIVIAPRSGAASTYRFFEAMSAGRPCVWLSDGYVPPRRPGLDWSTFSWQWPEDDVVNVGILLNGILKSHTDEQLVARGKLARAAWERWFHIDRWPALMAEQIVALLKKEGRFA